MHERMKVKEMGSGSQGVGLIEGLKDPWTSRTLGTTVFTLQDSESPLVADFAYQQQSTVRVGTLGHIPRSTATKILRSTATLTFTAKNKIRLFH